MRRFFVAVALVAACSKKPPAVTTPPDRSCIDHAACMTACSSGNQAACSKAAKMLRQGDGVRRDEPKEIALVTTACAANDADGCLDYGRRLRTGHGVKRDVAKGEELLKKAVALYESECDAGGARGCERASDMRRHGHPVVLDEQKGLALNAKALEVGEKGCRAKNVDACDVLTLAMALAHDTSPASVERKELACTNGVPAACNPRNPARATELATAACEKNDLYACNALAFRNDMGQDEDWAKDPAPLYERACERGLNDACRNAARWYAKPWPGRRSDDAKTALLEKKYFDGLLAECDAGYGDACNSAWAESKDARAVAFAPRTAEFERRGVEILDRQCKAGDGWACGELATHYLLTSDRAKENELNARVCELTGEHCAGK